MSGLGKIRRYPYFILPFFLFQFSISFYSIPNGPETGYQIKQKVHKTLVKWTHKADMDEDEIYSGWISDSSEYDPSSETSDFLISRFFTKTSKKQLSCGSQFVLSNLLTDLPPPVSI
ncbi:hypothetical protein [Leptospira haakeii]|uniref:Uncharacterized protein n=1 Tax=Leptospira haakeii TaxID=2023198 RepID=A0ABX4PGK3_9LEPT|nr:hypothetical protein [Leptospira haakeii]PKA14904.1 hypothetical protein CH363_16045 [Leptospira haakeii]PKA20443.1 hypothetical protein CH377_05860 [Leptospira haakeii]